MFIRDRVRELRRVAAGQLRPSPKNWRSHPTAQRDALKGLLAELGYCDALLARELADGALERPHATRVAGPQDGTESPHADSNLACQP